MEIFYFDLANNLAAHFHNSASHPTYVGDAMWQLCNSGLRQVLPAMTYDP